MAIHHLKTINPYYNQLYLGVKNFELRKNDRNFQVGDILVLQEFSPVTGLYSGEYIKKQIIMILEDCIEYGLMEGYCILALEDF